MLSPSESLSLKPRTRYSTGLAVLKELAPMHLLSTKDACVDCDNSDGRDYRSLGDKDSYSDSDEHRTNAMIMAMTKTTT